MANDEQPTEENSIVRISAEEWGEGYDVDVAMAVQMPARDMLPLVMAQLVKQGWRVGKDGRSLTSGGTLRGVPISRSQLNQRMGITCLEIMKERYRAEVARRKKVQ